MKTALRKSPRLSRTTFICFLFAEKKMRMTRKRARITNWFPWFITGQSQMLIFRFSPYLFTTFKNDITLSSNQWISHQEWIDISDFPLSLSFKTSLSAKSLFSFILKWEGIIIPKNFALRLALKERLRRIRPIHRKQRQCAITMTLFFFSCFQVTIYWIFFNQLKFLFVIIISNWKLCNFKQLLQQKIISKKLWTSVIAYSFIVLH